MGPFYCPLDKKVYIDLEFYRVLKERFHAPGDFAQAYVIAHEIGHHVQTLWGISEKVQALKQQAMRSGDQPRANAYQVSMELQADCLAGVWASINDQIKSRLQPGDVEAGLNAAAQIGDDTLQRRTQGQVVPEFVHARLLAAARALVQEGPRDRPHAGLRHLRRQAAVTTPPAAPSPWRRAAAA